MKRKVQLTLLLFFSLLIVPMGVAAQEPVDSVATDTLTLGELVDKVAGKKEKKVSFLHGVTVGADFVGLAMRLAGSDWSNAEILARINLLDKYFPIAELGLGYADHEGAELDNHFSVSAPYFRAGLDYNINKFCHEWLINTN